MYTILLLLYAMHTKYCFKTKIVLVKDLRNIWFLTDLSEKAKASCPDPIDDASDDEPEDDELYK